jgi:hypothetical protein
MMKLLLVLATGYVLLVAVIYLILGRLLYPPNQPGR